MNSERALRTAARRREPTQARSVVIAAAAGFLCFVATVTIVMLTGVVEVNVSSSMPRGLYRIERGASLHRGALVLVCGPVPAAELAVQRAYLLPGRCPGRAAPLFKRIAALAGDDVDVTATATIVDGCRLAASARIERDADGRSLPGALRRAIVPDQSAWLYARDAASFDSRYFGTVPIAHVIGVAHPLLLLDQDDGRLAPFCGDPHA